MTKMYKGFFGATVWLAVTSCSVAFAQQPSTHPPTAVIRFFAPIDAATIGALIQTVDTKYKGGTREFVILISSSGGDVLSGFAAYNYLKGLPIQLNTFNVGNVDSAALFLFCSGKKRYSVPNGRFVLHGTKITFGANATLDGQGLRAQLALLNNMNQMITQMLVAATGKTLQEVERAIETQMLFTAEEAQRWKLVHEIKSQLLDPGAELVLFNLPITEPSTTTPSITTGLPVRFTSTIERNK